MLWLIIFFCTFSTAKCDGNIQAKILTAFARQFRAPQPLAIFYNTSKETKIKLIKSMSKKGVTLHWNDELTYSKKFLLEIVVRLPYNGLCVIDVESINFVNMIMRPTIG